MKKWLKRLVLAGGALGVLLLLGLEALRFSATRSGVSEVPVVADSEFAQLAMDADYVDAFQAPINAPGVSSGEVLARAFQQGREVARSDQEVIYEGSAPGLRFLASYHFEPSEAGGNVTIGTAVFYESPLGRLYFTPVRIGHRRLVPFALARMAAQ